MTRLQAVAITVVILLAAVALRAPGLGDLGYVWDEDISALAAQGVERASLPTLPSGRVYARALPYSYACALFSGLTGHPETDLRLPGLLFSLISLILIVLLGREFGDLRAGLMGAALGAVSIWELALARNARMYPMLACLGLAFLLFWSRGYRRRTLGWQIVALLTLGLAVLVHDLAATMVVVYLYPFWRYWQEGDPSRQKGSLRRPLLATSMAVFMAGGMMSILRYLSATAGRQFEVPTQLPGNLAGGFLATLPAALAELGRLPRPELWDQPGGGFMAVAVLLAGLAILGFAGHRRLMPAPQVLAAFPAVLVVLAMAGHQVVLAAAGLWLLACRGRSEKPPPLTHRLDVMGGLVFVILAGLAWMVQGLATASEGLTLGSIRELLLAMIDIPQRFWWLLAELFPILFLLAVIVPAARMLGVRCPESVRFLGFVVVASFLAIGMGAAPSWTFRYIAHLNLIFLLLATVQLSRWLDRPAATSSAGRPTRSALQRGAVAVVLILLALEVAPPRRIYRRLTQTYAFAWPEPIGGPWEGFTFYPDEKSPALYVATHRRPGDRVVAMNWLSFAAYAGPADYWLRSSGYEVQVYPDGDALRDVYTGAMLIADAQSLRRVTMQPGDGRVWLVTSGLEVQRGKRVSAAMLAFLGEHEDKVVHVAADRRSKVYLFGPVPGP